MLLKPKRDNFKNSENIAVKYCENSSIHGIKYISNNNSRPLLEKALWIVILLVSFCLCGYLIARINKKRCESPVIVSFNEIPVPIWQIPFPAVTICPETKARTDEFRYTETLLKMIDNGTSHNFTKKELEQFNVVYQLCDNGQHGPEVSKNGHFDGSNYIETMNKLAPVFEETIFVCNFRDVENLPCEDLFSPVITDAGRCYTFNGLSGEEIYRTSELAEDFFLYRPKNSSSNWNIDDMYSNEDLKTYPQRGFDAKMKSGFIGILKLYIKDFDYICRGATQGFQLVLHSPAEQPQFLEEHHKIQLSTETTIKVHPKMTITTPSLKNIPPEKRGCFFNNERYLRFFQIYTKSNCEIECITNYTLSKCGCVKFNFPRDKTTRICTAKEADCYNTAEFDKMEKEIKQKMEEDPGDTDSSCNCFPVCNSVQYDADVTDVVFNWKEFVKAIKQPLERFNNSQLARINVFFKTSEFIANKRSELYSNTDFLANCGGLIGMFMGASLLSFIEIFYFCMLRLILFFRKIPVVDEKTPEGIISVTPATSNTKLNE